MKKPGIIPVFSHKSYSKIIKLDYEDPISYQVLGQGRR